MSIVEPRIDDLMVQVGEDRYLLCAIASKRSSDINDLMCNQRSRAISMQAADDVAQKAGTKPLSLAMHEIATGVVSYDKENFE
ncbi:MAG: DNA-directed RNA polymerase subunit omega [Coriobacteriales bacterium]|nr:DNA-directed RNA polymerase subunit omega [Coriobacteriales bacterium]